MLARSVVGSVETVRAGLDALIAETGVEDLLFVSEVYDHQARLRSMELFAEAEIGLPRSHAVGVSTKLRPTAVRF